MWGLAKPKAAHLRLGDRGERIAARCIRKLGWKILARNLQVGRHDEIDIVAMDTQDRVIVFVEVKTRKTLNPDYPPELNITPDKRLRMSKAARRWIAERNFDGGYRLDVLCVAEGRVIDHVRDVAFTRR